MLVSIICDYYILSSIHLRINSNVIVLKLRWKDLGLHTYYGESGAVSENSILLEVRVEHLPPSQKALTFISS